MFLILAKSQRINNLLSQLHNSQQAIQVIKLMLQIDQSQCSYPKGIIIQQFIFRQIKFDFLQQIIFKLISQASNSDMGKKDVLLDNGKKAQSAMTLYWKRNKQMSKHPKEKVQKQEDQQQVNDKRIMSNFQKWKLHKQKVITKAYTKPSQAQPPKEKVQQAKQQQQQNQLYEKMMQKKKPKIISVPGFKSKGDLTQRLQMQTVGPVDQSTNILKLPSHMQGLTQEQIIQMLRQRKSKQDFKKRQKKQDNDKEEDLILGEELVNLSKKQDIIQQPEQKQKQVKQQPYFKSDILNKIQRQGLSQGLSTTLNHNNQVDPQKQQPILNASPVTKQSPSQQEQPAITNGRFVPRVLKK